jgi:hypothetical protein
VSKELTLDFPVETVEAMLGLVAGRKTGPYVVPSKFDGRVWLGHMVDLLDLLCVEGGLVLHPTPQTPTITLNPKP